MSTSRRKSSNKSRFPRFQIRWWRVLLVVVLTVGIVGTAGASGFVLGTIRSMPSIDVLDPELAETSFVYDYKDNLITRLYGEQNRVPATYSEIPQDLENAIIDIEDRRFRDHFGVDPYGIMTAIWRMVVERGGLQGASTITQQLARTAWRDEIGGVEERTLRRKIQEAVLAIQLERRYTKEEILTMYLNAHYFGHGVYGVKAAAQVFFGKDLSELTLGESALLAGLPQSPETYSPYRFMDRAKNRRKQVLNAMVEAGHITEAQAKRATEEPIELAELKPYGEYPAPHYVDYVLTQLLDMLTDKYEGEGMERAAARKKASELVYSGGLRIYTALDPDIQKAAEESVAATLDPVFPMEEDAVVPQAAAVVLEVATGEIRAMVGGRSHEQMLDFNAAWQAHRQPGSAFKPVAVYSAAFDLGYTPATVIDDAPIVYEVGPQLYTPVNYDETFLGLTTLREGLRRSINAMAVRLLDQLGIDTGIEYAQKLGIESLVLEGPRNDRNLPLALGGLTKGVTPLEMARAYATFANNGVRTTPYAIRKVVDSDGNVLIDNKPQLDVALKEESAYIMTDVLRSVVEDQPGGGWLENWGTGFRANDSDVLAKWPVAGKTGTTNDVRDIWFVGYTPKYAGAVWMGYYEPTYTDPDTGQVRVRSIPNGSGGLWPAMIWRDTMTAAHADLEPVSFKKPDNITRAEICIKSGLLAGETCWPAFRRTEVFIKGTQPAEIGDDFTQVSVLQVTAEELAAHPEYIEQFPSLQWNKWVKYEPGCYGTPETKYMYNRPPVDFDEVKQAAQIFYKNRYTDGRALGFVPKDAFNMVPTVSCKDLPAIFGSQSGPRSSEPIEGDEADYELHINDRMFSPVLLNVYKDQLVHLHITNNSSKKAEFTMRSFDISVSVEPGETVTVDFTPEKTGIFTFYDKDSRSIIRQGRLIVRRP